MKSLGLKLFFVVLISGLLLTACNLPFSPSQPIDPGQLETLTAATVSSKLTQISVETLIAEATRLSMNTATPTVTSTPTITFSPTPIARIDLDTVFGSELKFVIHRVRSGESLSQYANQYLSTVEVIQWVNLTNLSPLRIDQLVVIPVASTVVDPQMPAFEAYQVQAASVSAQALAEDLQTDLAQFLLYNGLNSDAVLPDNHWLIIPRSRP